MFLTIHPYSNSAVFKLETGGWQFAYEHYIIDSEFGSEIWISYCNQWCSQDIVRPGSVIECYESRGEDVAYNLALYHMYMTRAHKWYRLSDEIGYCTEHVPKYDLYVEQVKAHLVKEAYL